MIDKKTIGLTSEGEKAMEKLMAHGCFKDMMDAAKFAMSVSIRHGDSPMVVEGANTIWNVGSFDSDGQIRQLIPVLYSACDTPYRAVESLIDQGLVRLSTMVDEGSFDPVTILQSS